MYRHPATIVLATDGAEICTRRRVISRSVNTVSADTTNVATLKYSARLTWSVLKYTEIEPSSLLMRASRLNRLACSSRSAGTRLGTVASLAGVQNSDAHEARNCTMYIQASLFTMPTDRSIGIVR